MPKRSKRSQRRRGSSAERNNRAGVDVAEKVGSDVGSQDDAGSMTNESVGDTSPTGEDMPIAETGDDKFSEAPVPQVGDQIAVEAPVPGSPSKDDQVLDAAAASPFLTPSGVSNSKVAAGDVELTFSPGSETGTVSKTVPAEGIMADSPGVNQTAIRVSPTAVPEDDLLRQSVDLAAMPAPASATAVAEDGSITVSVEPLEIVTGLSPKTDRSGSVPLSTTSPVVAYPQSPAVVVVAPTPLNASGVVATPLSSAVLAQPVEGVVPSSATKTPRTETAAPFSASKMENAAEVMIAPKTPSIASIPPAPVVAVLENADATLTVTPMTPSLAVPPIPIAMAEDDNPAQQRSMSRDRISAFISTTSPPRGTAMDSVALSQDPEMQRSIQSSMEPTPVAITESSAGPDIPFSPIDFETAIVRLTGRTGKSIRDMPAGKAENASIGGRIFGACMTCFRGGKSNGKSNQLTKELIDDKNAQTTLFSTPFDSQFEVHRRMLQTVYVVLTGGGANREALMGDHWKRIGFKTSDPASELNSVFHVLCMLYLLQELGESVPAENFAEISLKISSSVQALAKGGDLNHLYNKHRQVIPVSCHMYCSMIKRYMEVQDVLAVTSQAQSAVGVEEIFNLVPFPEHVAVTADNATAAALKASS